jgi:hypothetical protein
MLTLTGHQARRWEPKRLRLFSIPGRLAVSARAPCCTYSGRPPEPGCCCRPSTGSAWPRPGPPAEPTGPVPYNQPDPLGRWKPTPHPLPVVVADAEGAGLYAAGEPDQSVDGFGAAAAGAAGGGAGQERRPPLCRFGRSRDRAGRQGGEDPWAIRRASARLAACRPSGAAGRTAGALPGDVHLVVAFVGGDGAFQPGALPVDEPV